MALALGRVFSLTDYSYVAGLGTFGAIGNFKFNFVTLFKGFEPFPLNGGVVNKYVFAAFNLDKSKTLSVVEPFDSSCHWSLLLIKSHGVGTPCDQYCLSTSTFIFVMYSLP
jgi:hypothetical protein